MTIQFKGKVTYVSEPKLGKSGWFNGFTLDSLPKDFYLNDFKDNALELVRTKVGDTVTGSYKDQGKWHVIQTFEKINSTSLIPKTEKPLTDFKQSDEISPVDIAIEFNTRLIDNIHRAFSQTDTFEFFKSDKAVIQDLETSLFIAIRDDLKKY